MQVADSIKNFVIHIIPIQNNSVLLKR